MEIAFQSNKAKKTNKARATNFAALPKSSAKTAANMEYFTRLHAQLDDHKCMRNFFEFLRNRDISKYDPRVYPSSTLRDAMIESQEKPETSFLRQWVFEDSSPEQRRFVSEVDLHGKYVAFYSAGHFRADYLLNRNTFKAAVMLVGGFEHRRRAEGKNARGFRVSQSAVEATIGKPASDAATADTPLFTD
jgi:hypothetical protein